VGLSRGLRGGYATRHRRFGAEVPAIDPGIPRLVHRARAGDPAAQESLYTTHVDAVFGYCLAFARGDRARAQDLTQESFARALSALDDLRDPERFSGWLMTITRRACLRWVEGQQRERKVLTLMAREPTTRDGDEAHLITAVAEVIAACPDPGQRQAAALFYSTPGHTTQQIADQLGLSRTAVTTRLHRFRSWLKRRKLGQLIDALEGSPWTT